MTAPAGGLVIVDKAGGMTSHDVVARVRRLAGTRKVGHAGTLDPMATGVLVLGVGRATRLLGHLAATTKSYDATIRLGVATDTDDAEGRVVGGAAAGRLDPERVRRALAGFVGEIEQVPSAVSAVKVAGRRAYSLARSGEPPELAPRRVRVEELVVHEVRPAAATTDVRVSVTCSSGTYVRAIARDLGATLGVGGHLTELRRLRVGRFDLTHARPLDDVLADFAVLGLAEAVRAGFPCHDLDPAAAAAVRVGRPLELPLPGLTALFAPDGEFLALYRPAGGQARPVAVFVG